MKKIGIKCTAVMLVLAVIMSCVPIIGFAKEVKSGTCGDNLTWELDDEGTLTVSGTGDMENYGGNYINPAPWYSQNITKIVINEGVTGIGDYAFCDVNNSSSIELPNSLERIGKGAFFFCRLTSIDIPSNVTSISDDAFEYCTGLESINVSEENKNYSSVDGVLFNKDKTTLISYGHYKTGDNYIIPSTVKKINSSAFFGNINLKSVEIPNSVTEIADKAFNYCSLTSVEIPNSVKLIGEMAFADCDLTSIELPNSLEVISRGTFSGCEKLESVKLPTSITAIEISLFSGCCSLTDVVIPNNIKSIGNYAFSDCSKLENIKIPESVTTIGESAFSGCVDLANVELTNGLQEIGKSVFGSCKSLVSIKLPDSVTKIGESAFSSCFKLFNINIPDSVTLMGENAFGNCMNLKNVKVSNGITAIRKNTFSGCTMLERVEIPTSMTEIDETAFAGCITLTDIYYLGTEEQWNDIITDTSNKYLTNATIHYNQKIIYSMKILDPYKTQLSAEASKTGDMVTVTVTLNDETTINTDNIVVLAGQFSDGAFTSATELKPTAEGMKITYTGDVKSDDYSLFIWENYNGVYKPITEKI